MLGIIWAVLKIILLIIGIILGIVLLLLLILLFSPIKYSTFAKKEEVIDINGKLSLLFGMVRAEFISNDGDSELILKYPFKKKDKISEPMEDSAVYIQQLGENAADEAVKKEEPEITESTFTENSEPRISEPEEKIKKSGFKEKLQGFIDSVKYKISGIKGFIDRLKDYKAFISEISSKYDIRSILEKTALLTKKLFKNIGFKVFEINGIIGFEDPAMTGKVLGALAAADCIIPADVAIDGDFENKRLEGSLVLSGRTSVFKMSFPVIVYLLRKPVRPVIIDLIRGDKNE